MLSTILLSLGVVSMLLLFGAAIFVSFFQQQSIPAPVYRGKKKVGYGRDDRDLRSRQDRMSSPLRHRERSTTQLP